ncbi:hypothetical protein Q1695_008096 [Nippostrongylus brasiliensis]|nr:hypothetical protein Q1695_008096 [Nippostrongylus brasiliensis]
MSLRASRARQSSTKYLSQEGPVPVYQGMIYMLVRMLAIVQSSWALHCRESTKYGQSECHTEFFIDYHRCSEDLRSRTSSHKGHPIYTSGSELVIECSSSECLEDPNLFLTAQQEGMTSLEKEAAKCLDELVKGKYMRCF